MMRNFVTEEAISDQLFSLPVFLHIGVALLVLLGVWVHLTRLARPLAQPQRRLAASFALALLPALATAPAEFSRVPRRLCEMQAPYSHSIVAGGLPEMS